MRYVIDYGIMTVVYDTDELESVLDEADAGIGYTGHSVVVTDEAGKDVARREWYGVDIDWADCEDEDVISYGQFGYYTSWRYVE